MSMANMTSSLEYHIGISNLTESMQKSIYFTLEYSPPLAVSTFLNRTIHSVAVSLIQESTMTPASSLSLNTG